MAASLGRVWQQKVNEGLKTIIAVLDGLSPSVRGEINRERAFERGDLDVVLQKDGAKAFVVVSYEARNQRAQLQRAFAEISSQMSEQPGYVHLVTSLGIRKVPLPQARGALSLEEWEHVEDEVSFLEGDNIAQEFFESERR